MTHKLQNNYTKEILALLRKCQDTQQISQPGDLENGLRIPRDFDFGSQWDLIIELTGLVKHILGGYKQNLVCTRTQEKGAVIPQETDPELYVRVQEYPGEARSEVAWCRVGGTECGSACKEPFDGGLQYIHYLHHSLNSGQATEREHSPTNQQKIGLKVY